MKKVIGRFYFKQTINGNLIGEFSNNGTLKNYTESADLNSDTRKDVYVGVYDSTWHEDKACFAKLEITKKHDSIFTLKWIGEGSFEGEGMLCDNILIGNYWSI